MILGINLSHDYALCTLEGDVVRLTERERSSRIRYHGIDYDTLELLDSWSEEELRQLRGIYLCSPFMNRIQAKDGDVSSPQHRWRYQGDYLNADSPSGLVRGELHGRGMKIPAGWVSHYHAHAASAFFPTSFERAAVLCIDGRGDFGFGASFLASGLELELVERYEDWRFGLSYHHFAEAVFEEEGFHEGKLMAAAIYGDRERAAGPVFTPSGELEPLDGRPSVHDAARCQHDFIQAALKLLDDPRLAEENLACAGGCFLNVGLNWHMAQEERYRRIYIPPYVGDMGTALGAALVASVHLDGRIPPRSSFQHAYLGHRLEADLATVERLVAEAGDELCVDEALCRQESPVS